MYLRHKMICCLYRAKKIKRGWPLSHQYVHNLDEKLNDVDIQSLNDLGKILLASATSTTPDAIDDDPRPLKYNDVKYVISQRRDCGDPQEYRELSKRIYRLLKFARCWNL